MTLTVRSKPERTLRTGDIVTPKNPKWMSYNKNVPQGGFNTQTPNEEQYFKSKFDHPFDTRAEGVYYKWPGNGAPKGDWVVLTQNQEENHCGIGHTKFPCGNTPVITNE